MRFFVIGCSTLLLIIVFIFFLVRSDFLKIQSVDLQFDKIDCANTDQIKNSSNLLGQNMLLMDSTKIKNQIKIKFLCIKNVEITRRLPNRVNIFISGRQPYAKVLVFERNEATQSANLETIATPSAAIGQVQSNFLVDNEGIIYAKDGNISDVLKIYYNGANLALGQKPKEISDSLKILEKVKSFNISLGESEIFDGIFLIFPKDSGPRIIFKLEDNLDTKLASLQLILGQAKMDENQLEFIDLRFDKPIVKFAPKRKNG